VPLPLYGMITRPFCRPLRLHADSRVFQWWPRATPAFARRAPRERVLDAAARMCGRPPQRCGAAGRL